jgi:hypothetical protein
MTGRRVAAALGLLFLAVPALVAAQGLGDAAARERAKREAAKKAEAKVFTNSDLEQGRPAGTPAPSGAASASPPSSGSSPPSSGAYIPEGEREQEGGEESSSSESVEDRRAQERAYVEDLQAAQNRLAQTEARIRELQAKLNPMSTTFIYGDFNVSGNKAAEEAAVRAELTQSEAGLSSARQAVAAATRALQDFKQGRVPAPVPVE